VASRFLRRSGSEESIQWESRRSCASAPSLSFHPMPFRITQESYRPRVSYRTMVGALPPALLASFRSRMASTTIRVMKPSECEQLGLTLRREKAIQTKWQSGEGAGCRRNSTVSGGGRRMSLDIPFYRTFPQPRLGNQRDQRRKGNHVWEHGGRHRRLARQRHGQRWQAR